MTIRVSAFSAAVALFTFVARPPAVSASARSFPRVAVVPTITPIVGSVSSAFAGPVSGVLQPATVTGSGALAVVASPAKAAPLALARTPVASAGIVAASAPSTIADGKTPLASAAQGGGGAPDSAQTTPPEGEGRDSIPRGRLTARAAELVRKLERTKGVVSIEVIPLTYGLDQDGDPEDSGRRILQVNFDDPASLRAARLPRFTALTRFFTGYSVKAVLEPAAAKREQEQRDQSYRHAYEGMPGVASIEIFPELSIEDQSGVTETGNRIVTVMFESSEALRKAQATGRIPLRTPFSGFFTGYIIEARVQGQ
ncbi:MAG: hypothetical protein HY553_08885 [Elusimicrobia bacterium]|nr:hypothetical protein [Elusimicrobiota bacterium]